MRVVVLLALLFLAACSSTSSSSSGTSSPRSTVEPSSPTSPTTAPVTVPPPGSQTADGGCGATRVFKGGTLPGWATVNAPASLPYVVANPPIIIGYIFTEPLTAGSDANKILWYVWTPREGPLTAIGHPLGLSSPTATFTKAADSGPGEIYPSGPTVPSPGCWQFSLTWNGGGTQNQAEVDLMFK
jgi:hypothetical protein